MIQCLETNEDGLKIVGMRLCVWYVLLYWSSMFGLC